MTTISNDRPQDVARPHRRTRGVLAPETDALLKRYRATMEAELSDLLSEIRPDAGQLTIGGAVDRRWTIAALWDLAIKSGANSGPRRWLVRRPDSTPNARRPARCQAAASRCVNGARSAGVKRGVFQCCESKPYTLASATGALHAGA